MTYAENMQLAENVERTAAYSARRLGADAFKTPDGQRDPDHSHVILVNANRRDVIARALRFYAEHQRIMETKL